MDRGAAELACSCRALEVILILWRLYRGALAVQGVTPGCTGAVQVREAICIADMPGQSRVRFPFIVMRL